MHPTKHFERWVKSEPNRELLCHFYVNKNSSQYYGNPEFAYFNFTNPSAQWIIAGTTGHGVKTDKGEQSQVPCLNCFDVDDEFCSKLISRRFQTDNKYEIGLILDKNKIRNQYLTFDVELCYGHKPLSECYKFDNPKYRKGVLDPFNYCRVVRIKIPKSPKLSRPITVLYPDVIVAMLVRPEVINRTLKALAVKQMPGVKVFGAL